LLITFWGWPELSDYACREWSGLIRDYYLPRWSQWLEARMRGESFSTEIWEQTWLSRPYRPSQPMPVTDLAAACGDLLQRCGSWIA
jgi:alpha-N-acetylglucosaminidase